KCKIVVIGDSQCGKTALLHVFAKDCFPENYVPTVFENYTASFEIDSQRIELSLWDTSGATLCGMHAMQGWVVFVRQGRKNLLKKQERESFASAVCIPEQDVVWRHFDKENAQLRSFISIQNINRMSGNLGIGTNKRLNQKSNILTTAQYLERFTIQCSSSCSSRATHCCLLRSPYYDNVRPLSYPDSDAVLICFDISRPETLDSVLKKWKGEIQEFCPNTKMLLVGCKSDLRTDLSTLVELSNHRQTPVSYDQGSNMAKQISAPYIECSALQSENSVRDIFHVATLACVNKNNKNVKRQKSSRATKRTSHMPSRPYLESVPSDMRKDKAKSCTVM
ncbi:rho-related GTP-binding protein RhoE, partial [Silurus meridionalis]